MDSYTVVYTKDSSDNILPLNYVPSTNKISFNMKQIPSEPINGINGSFEFDNLSTKILTVTQTTSITTSVTLNEPYGIIRLFSPFDLSSRVVSFTFYNSLINSNSIIINHILSCSNNYYLICSNIRYVSSGNAKIDIFAPNLAITPGATSGVSIYYRIFSENIPLISV